MSGKVSRVLIQNKMGKITFIAPKKENFKQKIEMHKNLKTYVARLCLKVRLKCNLNVYKTHRQTFVFFNLCSNLATQFKV